MECAYFLIKKSNSDLKWHSLVSMNFSILSMLLKSVSFLETMDAKSMNITIFAEIVEMHSVNSKKPLATNKIYIKCDTKTQPNNKKPKIILSLNVD